MEEMSLQRLRNLILDVYTIDESNLIFDTDTALSKGYSIDEVEFANKVFELNPLVSFHTFHLKNDLRYFLDDDEFNPIIFYIQLAELIFIIDLESEVYSYMFEEDLQEKVAEKRAFADHLEYLMTQVNNDAYGEPL